MTYATGDPRAKLAKQRAYQKARQKYVASATARRLKRYELLEALKKNPCSDCKQTFHPTAMEFDHLPEHEKIDSITALVTHGASLEAILLEVAKCELVCANCHRVRSAQRREKRRLGATVH